MVQPRSAEEVQLVVHVVRDHGLTVTVKGGGHDWAGRALNDGGLVIDLSAMCEVHIDPTKREAVVDGGATANDVVRAAELHGLTAATGSVGDVGMVGFTLGGGYGPINGVAGMGVDNLIEADLVLADGRLVTTNSAIEPDLFWALRGGGGNFGVVTRIRIRLHAWAEVTTGVITFPWQQAADVLQGYEALSRSMPDHLTVQSGVISGADGQPTVFLAPTWVGTTRDAEQWISELRRLGSPLLQQVGPLAPSAQLHLLDSLVPPALRYEMRTVNIASLSTNVIDAVVRAGSTRTSQSSAISLHHFHGASTRVGPTDTAFGIRVPHRMVEIIGAWETGDGAEHRRWAQACLDDLQPHSLPGGYPNLLGPLQRAQADAAYGPNAERLVALKRQWDGENMFAATLLPAVPPR
ncbi:6-hydroxy-D-nicotine oxidase [Mycolicibacterium canariasense]|uniref:6-hydroxy-D-nicotine oxidase n=1 Tax=Mycolicibacterium canariasense TaxID=228230 RepID=A0A117IA78_MYCCR|nr:6-hydroxy-D-nicotine oxidase [Mycolicibacterium canariasense]